MSSTHNILLRGGTLLLHRTGPDGSDLVVPTKSDLLISGNTIAAIGESLEAPVGSQVVDVTEKIISPGFIDTHRHMWNQQLKGRHANEVLRQYVFNGALMAMFYQPDDAFWGQLSACMEAIDAGTTLVVDHSHINYSPEQPDRVIEATVASGLRSIFCYSPDAIRALSANPTLVLTPDPLPEWALAKLDDLATKAPWGNGRVTLGLGFDAHYLPEEILGPFWTKAKSLVSLITTHDVNGPLALSSVAGLAAKGRLGPGVLISHATNPTPETVSALVATGTHTSAAPSVELSMQLGDPICFHKDLHATSSLGVDCASAVSASIPEVMRVALQYARGKYNQQLLDEMKGAKTVNWTVMQAFNLGTIMGARAAGMADVVGSLEVGKRADIVVFDGTSPSMCCVSRQDPVAAVVLHSTVRDVEIVIVDGVVRKQDGKLLSVKVDKENGGRLQWIDVSKRVESSREDIVRRSVEHGLDVKKLFDEPLAFDDPRYILV